VSVEESGFRFTQGASWAYFECWDEHRGFTGKTGGIEALNGELDGRPEGTKAVDFVGVRDRDLWLFEVKDFRNRPVEYKKRLGELPLEVALKVRDTIAGLVACHRQDVEPWIAASVKMLADRRAELTVVAWIARPGPWRSLPDGKRKVHENVLMKGTRQRLQWLTRRVFVLDCEDQGRDVPDLIVTPLPQR
jgi:hypothetical protein